MAVEPAERAIEPAESKRGGEGYGKKIIGMFLFVLVQLVIVTGPLLNGILSSGY